MTLSGRTSRAILLVFLVVALAFAAATAARYGLVERDDLGPACEVASPGWQCHARMVFIHAFLHGVFGYASLALAAYASWRRAVLPACFGLVAGTFGMVLYDFTWSGVGVVACAVLIARLLPHREPEQHAH
jgi:hypothetical protein